MGDAAGSDFPSGGEGEVRLESWKAIAAYLGRGVTTVQRWEREEGLPVRRHAHAARGSVFAFRREIDDWRSSREATGLPALPQTEAVADPVPVAPAAPEPVVPPRWKPYVATTAASVSALAIVALSVAAWWQGLSPDVPPASPSLVAASLTTGNAIESNPGLSPDGRLVAYMVRDAGGSSRLFIRPTAGGPARPLLADPPRPAGRTESSPRWSPDGQSIAFLREVRTAVWDLRIVPASGGASRKLLTMATRGVAWMPDGGSLVILDRQSQTEPYSAYLVSASTGVRLRRLTTPGMGTFGDWQCDVSADGRQLAVVRFRSPYHADIWVVEIESGSERQLTSGLNDIEGVAWMPDSRTLVFSAAGADGPTLWTIAAAATTGERPTRVPGSEGRAKGPAFSRRPVAGGAALAFVDDEWRTSLWRWDRRAVAAASPMTSSHRIEGQPALSPDGRRVTFVSTRTGSPEIWVDSVDGGAARQLTFRGERVAMPRWAPNGNHIVYTSWTRDNQDVFSVRSTGDASEYRLTFETSVEDNPSWSRDGRWIYFRSDRDGFSRIYKMPSSGGPALPVTRAEGSQAIESMDGTQVYFVRSHAAAGLWSMPVGGGRESFISARVWQGKWDVTAKGVVAWEHDGRTLAEPVFVRLYDMRGGVRELGILPTPVGVVKFGVSASPDAEVLLWSTNEQVRSAIMVSHQWPAAAPVAAARR